MGKRGPPPEKLALLFRLKYLEEVSDEKKLAEKLGVQKKSLRRYEYRLGKKLVAKLGQISPDRLQLVCPECLEARVYDDPETGERVCTVCGYVVRQQPTMIHRLPFDQTYALENQLVFNKSLGGTLDKKTVGRVLTKVRNSKAKTDEVEKILEKYRKGDLSALEAGREIREILVNGGAEEIADVVQQGAGKEKG